MEMRMMILLTGLAVLMLYVKPSGGQNRACYICNGTECEDPFDAYLHTPQLCSGDVYCGKTKTTGGPDVGVIRYCASTTERVGCTLDDYIEWFVYRCYCRADNCNSGITPRSTLITLGLGTLFKIVL